ncbi:hypothetical protein OIO90_004386 [Microbotryomycetes sp. JL221]|nr:hypothetical protein OIO90_004386 [Microbotryomycetes sp. JL221]
MKRLFNKKEKSSSTPTPPDGSSNPNGLPLQQGSVTDGTTQASQHQSTYQAATGGNQYRGVAPGVPQGYVLMHAPVLVPVAQAGMRPPPPTQVSNAIGWSCASSTFDFPFVLALADHLSSSSAASKEAAKALRKEFKHATPEAQERAVRLTGILMRNTDVRFREQVASKKFLADWSDMFNSKKTDARVKDMILRVLSPLAYEYQRDADLSPITALYNKLKPFEAPVNGLPLDPDDPLLQPTIDPRTSGNSQGMRRRGPHRLPSTQQQMTDLRRKADEARGNARMLSEAIAYSKPDEDIKRNEIIQEFYMKCFQDQEFLSNNLQWATVQAEQSRVALNSQSQPQTNEVEQSQVDSIRRVERQGDDNVDTTQRSSSAQNLSSNNPFAPIVSGEQNLPTSPATTAPHETPEEQTLAVLLAAHSEIVEALQSYDSHLSNLEELNNVKAAQERSKLETRFDRSKAGVPDQNGDYQQQGVDSVPDMSRLTLDPFADVSSQRGASGRSREPSPPRSTTMYSQGYNNGVATPRSKNPYAAYLSPQSTGPNQASIESAHESNRQAYSSPPTQQDHGNYVIPDTFDSYRQSNAPVNDYGSNLLDDSPTRLRLEPLTLDTKPTYNGRAGGASLETPQSATMSGYAARRRDTSESASEGLQTPVVPSEKALGKLRRMSSREESDISYLEQQQNLEDALRQKYARNYQENHHTPSD